jgi:hypothetical protein
MIYSTNRKTQPKLYLILVGLTLFVNESFAQKYEYILMLNTTDCMNCSVMFKHLDDSFFTKYGLSYTVLVNTKSTSESERIIRKYFKLNKENIAKVLKHPKLYKKLLGNATYSKLIVKSDGKHIYDEEVFTIDIRDIPINYKFTSTQIAKYSKKQGIPFYTNELLPNTNDFLIRNFVYNEYYKLSKDGRKVTKIELKDTLYKYILLNFTSTHPELIDKFINHYESSKVEYIKYAYIYPTKNTNYLLLTLYVPKEDLINDTKYNFLCQLDSNYYIKSVSPIYTNIGIDSLKLNINTFYPIVIQNNALIASLFLPANKIDNEQINNFYITAYFKFDSSSSSYNWVHFGENFLDTFYTKNGHFYTNTWLQFCVINDTVYSYYKYLNYLSNTLSGEKILLPELNTVGLKLPNFPGGDSNKPFEILNVSEFAEDLITYSVFSKRKTTTYLFNTRHNKLITQYTFNTIIPPAVSYYNGEIKLVVADISGNLYLHKLSLMID